MKNAYISLLALVFGIAAIYGGMALLAAPSVRLGNYLERRQWEQGKGAYSTLKDDLPFEVASIHKEVFELAPRNNLILVGASNTRDAIWPDTFTPPSGWHYHNIGISAATVTSMRLLVNFLNDVAGHPPNKTDVVVVNLWYANLWNRPLKDDYLKSDLEMFGQYRVDSSLQVHGRPQHWRRELALTNYRMHGALAWPFGWPQLEPGLDFPSLRRALGLLTEGRVIPAAAKPPRRGTAEAAEAYREFYGRLMQGTSIPGSTTDELKDLLRSLNAQTNVVVVNLYAASWHDALPWQRDYQAWLKSDLEPILNRENIPFIDFQNAIPDREFIDGAHLDKEGRIRYTHLFSESIARVLPNEKHNHKKPQ